MNHRPYPAPARQRLDEPVVHSAVDGIPLHTWFWAGEEPRGVLVVAHGIGEYGGCYEHVAEALTALPGLGDVLAPDFRGHGMSPGRRGVVRRYEDLVGDLRGAVDWAREHRPGGPVFLLGHSNGGQVALRFALDNPGGVAGLV